MNAAATANAILRPRPPRGMGKGFALAMGVHVLLIAALAFSVRWRSSEPAGVEAELWAAVPQIAAPRGAPDPEPPPPRPEPKAEPRPVAKPPEPVSEKLPDAQIAVERAKRDEAKREEMRRQELQRQAEQRDRQREKQDDERRQKEAQKETQDKAKKEQERLDAAREAQMQRILGQAGATGEPRSTGTAARTAGPSAGYAGRIKARIKPNIIFADSVAGNPEAVVQVRVAPDGTITSRKLVRSSGIPAYDEAVLRAIDKTETLPLDNGTVPPVMELAFRPNE